MEVANGLVGSLAHAAGEGMKNKDLLKNHRQVGIEHLMYQAIPDAGFAQKALLGVKGIKMRITIVLILVSKQIFV